MKSTLYSKLLAASAAALMSVAAFSAHAQAGTYQITKNKFQLSSEFHIPKANVVTPMPWQTVTLQETADATLITSGSEAGWVLINTRGLYQVSLGLDWKAQENTDIGLRLMGIRRKAAGDNTPPTLSDQRLGSINIPGSDAPAVSRVEADIQSFVLSGTANTRYVDVTLTPNAATVNQIFPGDSVSVGLTSDTVANMGESALMSLSIEGKVISKNTVRIIFRNVDRIENLIVPAGKLRIVAQSSVNFRGDSEDGWNVLHTPVVELFPGDRIYVIVKNKNIMGDYIQPSPNSTFLQVTRFN